MLYHLGSNPPSLLTAPMTSRTAEITTSGRSNCTKCPLAWTTICLLFPQSNSRRDFTSPQRVDRAPSFTVVPLNTRSTFGVGATPRFQGAAGSERTTTGLNRLEEGQHDPGIRSMGGRPDQEAKVSKLCYADKFAFVIDLGLAESSNGSSHWETGGVHNQLIRSTGTGVSELRLVQIARLSA